jgi:hypothetical protein
MPQYTFEVGPGTEQCEICDVELSDNDAAADFAISLASALFSGNTEIYWDRWHLCSIKVWSSRDLVFLASIPRAAMMERDIARESTAQMVDH